MPSGRDRIATAPAKAVQPQPAHSPSGTREAAIKAAANESVAVICRPLMFSDPARKSAIGVVAITSPTSAKP